MNLYVCDDKEEYILRQFQRACGWCEQVIAQYGMGF